DTTLSSSAADFAAAHVNAGDVVLVAGVTLEVLSRSDPHTLEVSLPRAAPGDPPIPPTPGSQLAVQVRTFAPQAAVVHDALLRMIGIDPDYANASPNEDAIVSLSLMARLEALGTLARIYAGGAAAGENTAAMLQKEAAYRRLFERACRGAVVRLDLDHDGFADATRRPGVGHVRRV